MLVLTAGGVDLRIPVVYTQVMVAGGAADLGSEAVKSALVAQTLKNEDFPVDFVDPFPVLAEDFIRVHDPKYVTAVLAGRDEFGGKFFGHSIETIRSFAFVGGAFLTGAKKALEAKRAVVVAVLASGGQEVGWSRVDQVESDGPFNYLMVAAAHLIQHNQAQRIVILDTDPRGGSGTEDVLSQTGFGANILYRPMSPTTSIEEDLARYQPDLIFYQVGSDEGLASEQMGRRDELVFTVAQTLGVPVVFNVTSDYLGAFSAALRVHGPST
ncbi:MAG: hypothetical protein RBT63_09950 [Bdellovibrionales bacterium]|nr:hypothetical protein [Bdellovibrionales bacterium]